MHRSSYQTWFVGKGSDRLQLIKFWPSCAPGKGSAAGQNFLAPPYYSQRAVFASLRALFFIDPSDARNMGGHIVAASRTACYDCSFVRESFGVIGTFLGSHAAEVAICVLQQT